MPKATPLLSGDPERLGPYELTGRLGEGGQGTVFLGTASSGGDSPGDDSAAGGAAGGDGLVAVKLLHARLTGDAKARSRFAAEVAVAQRVAPFCTARILDADVEGGTPYIVSEYIDGKSLQDTVSAEGPRRGTALDQLAIGTITALTAIHQAGVVHRDFKPSNVLLAAGGPRVIDFGIARALDATGTVSQTAVGTPAYMAPEQISGTGVGPAADVFAWGCTMAFAAGGRPPFGLDSIPAVMNRIINLPPDLSMLGPPLYDIVAQCLAKDSSARPTAQDILLRLLGHAGPGPQAPRAAASMLTEGAQAAANAEAAPSSGPSAAAASPGLAPPGSAGQSPTPGVQSPAPSAPPSGPAPAAPVPGAQGGPWAPPPAPYQPVHPAGAPSPYGSYSTDPGAGRQSTHPAAPPYQPLAGPYTPAPHRRRPHPGVPAGAGTAAFVALVLLGTFAFFKLGPGGGGGTTSPTPGAGRFGGTMNMATTYAPTAIDPSNASYGPDMFIAKQLFTGLTEISPDGSVNKRLAQDLRPNANCTSWTIAVKQGTTFSNGEPVDPQSFVRGWNRAAQSATGSALFVMDNIKGYDAVRAGRAESMLGVRGFSNTLQVDLLTPDCEFDRRLATVPFFPVPSSAGEVKNETYNSRPIGNGPFKVISYAPKSKLRLGRNDSWVGGRAKLDAVNINVSDYTTQVTNRFDSGEYDWAALSTSDLGTAKSHHGNDGQLLTHNLEGMDFLVPVTARGPLKSKQAREAVSYAIDRQALSSTLFAGLRPPATRLIPPTLPGFDDTAICPSCERPDQAKAKQLAAQAGLGPGTKVTLVVRKNSSTSQSAEAIAQRLKSVLGWDVTQRQIELSKYEDFSNALTGKSATGLGRSSWIGDYASAYNFLHSLIGGGQASKISDWRDPQFDQLLRQAIATPDESSRNTLLKQAEKIAMDDLAVIPLWVYSESRLANTRKFTGLSVDYDGDPTLATTALK
jgi:ABC-type oligopeptide transport system substrate-binding subunit/serine/threonine protein kinase